MKGALRCADDRAQRLETRRPDPTEARAPVSGSGTRESVEEAQVLRSALHGMDEFFGVVIPDKHHDLQEPRSGIKPNTQLALRNIVVERSGYQR